MSRYIERTYHEMGYQLVVDDEAFMNDSRFYNLLHFFEGLPKGSLLDLGCGQGSVLATLKGHHDVYGLEFDAGARATATARGLSVQSIDLDAVSTLPFTFSFDYILVSEVCEHLLDPRNVFRLAFSHLKVGGLLVVTVPNAIPLKVRWDLLWGRTSSWIHYPSDETEKTGHIRFYSFQSLRSLGEQEGFDCLLSRGLSWRLNGDLWSRLFYHFSRMFGAEPTISERVMRCDDFMSRMFPTLSPGIMMVFKKPSMEQQASDRIRRVRTR
jgi:SAM-dependent methyltransferase